jgi:hypothetical protein
MTSLNDQFRIVNPGPPLHEQINPATGDRSKPEPLVEPERGIEAFDVDAPRLAGGAASD